MGNLEKLVSNVEEWADNKGLIDVNNATKQMLKVVEEVGETAGALAKNDPIGVEDGIGDAFVTLIILSKQLGLSAERCLTTAWNEIKDRTGVLSNGVFIKDE